MWSVAVENQASGGKMVIGQRMFDWGVYYKTG